MSLSPQNDNEWMSVQHLLHNMRKLNMKNYKLNQPGNNHCYFYLAKSKEPCWGDVTLSNTEYNSDWGEPEDIFECEGHKGCFDEINFYKNVEN